jgi:hypothetical protein
MTLSALGIFSAAGAGGAAVSSDYELISTTVLGTATSSVAFASLGTYSSTYKHLQVRYVARDTYGATANAILMRINSETSGYSNHILEGNGSAVSSNGITNTVLRVGNIAEASATANSFGAGVIDILDPYSTTKNKTVRSFAGVNAGGANLVTLMSGAYLSTTAVSSLTFVFTDGSNAVVGSRFSLYGIKG